MLVAVAKCIHCKKDVCMVHTESLLRFAMTVTPIARGLPAQQPQERGRSVNVHICANCNAPIVLEQLSRVEVFASIDEIHKMYDATVTAHHLTR